MEELSGHPFLDPQDDDGNIKSLIMVQKMRKNISSKKEIKNM